MFIPSQADSAINLDHHGGGSLDPDGPLRHVGYILVLTLGMMQLGLTLAVHALDHRPLVPRHAPLLAPPGRLLCCDYGGDAEPGEP